MERAPSVSLPGVKRFDDGTELDCPLENITLRRITDIRQFKIYDQPNLEMGRDKDFSNGVGSIRISASKTSFSIGPARSNSTPTPTAW